MAAFHVEASVNVTGEFIVMASLAVVVTIVSARLLDSRLSPAIPQALDPMPTALSSQQMRHDHVAETGVQYMDTATQTEVSDSPIDPRQLTTLRRSSLAVRPQAIEVELVSSTCSPKRITGISHRRPTPLQHVGANDATVVKSSVLMSPIRIHRPRPLRRSSTFSPSSQAAISSEQCHATDPARPQLYSSPSHFPYACSARLVNLRKMYLTPLKIGLPTNPDFWVSATLPSHSTAARPLAYALAGYEADHGYMTKVNHGSSRFACLDSSDEKREKVGHEVLDHRWRKWKVARQHSLEMRSWIEPGCGFCEDGSVYSLQGTSSEEDVPGSKQSRRPSMIGRNVLPSPVSSFDEQDPGKRIRELAAILRGLPQTFENDIVSGS